MQCLPGSQVPFCLHKINKTRLPLAVGRDFAHDTLVSREAHSPSARLAPVCAAWARLVLLLDGTQVLQHAAWRRATHWRGATHGRGPAMGSLQKLERKFKELLLYPVQFALGIWNGVTYWRKRGVNVSHRITLRWAVL